MQPDNLPPCLRSFLEKPGLSRRLVLLGLALGLPSVATGLQVDDLYHQALLRRFPGFEGLLESPLRLFTFFDGDPGRTGRMIEHGITPWWTLPTLRLDFFRPLAAITHFVDHALWSSAPWAMHVHSLLWFALVIAVATTLYRRLLDAGAGVASALAALMFAVDDVHSLPATWVASRNATMATAFGLLALLAHHRASRSRAFEPAALLGPLALAAALLCGETALGAAGFLVSHALFLEEDAIGRRVRRLLPFGAVLVGWFVLYRLSGSGASGSDLYVDPAREPLRFLGTALVHFPLLATSMFGLPVDGVSFLPRNILVPVVIACWGFVLAVAVWLAPIVRERPVARFFALGMVLAMVPACSTVPSVRLLFFAGFGALGLVAQAVVHGPRRRARAALVVHLALAPLLFLVNSFQMPLVGSVISSFERSVTRDPQLESQVLIAVTTFDASGSGYVLIRRQLEGGPAPSSTRAIALGEQATAVERVDDRTLLVQPDRGFLADNFSRMVRDRRERFEVGSKIAWGIATIEIAALTEDGRPASARFRFDEPLESPRYRFVQMKGRGYAPFALPAIGERVVLPPEKMF